MRQDCVPYPRKTLYLLLTVPMMGIYVAIAVFLWHVNTVAFVAYCALFSIVAFGQSYVCVYLRCPYVGRFAPCVGGFCLPASQIARLLKNVKRSARIYNVSVSLAFLALLGIILLPIPFLYAHSAVLLLAYLGIVVAYAASFLWLICPACGIRHVCPGGQASTKLRGLVARE